MSRNQFYYLDAFGAEIEKGACHDGTYYLFYDSNVIINLSREELNHKNTKIDDMIMFISSIEKSYVQYDTACLEMFSRSFSKSLDEQKDEMIGFAIKLEGWMSDRGIITERSNFVSMNDYLLLYKSVKHLRVMQLCLMAITFTLIENRDKTPLEKFELFAKWYDDKVGIRLVLIIRLAILIFYHIDRKTELRAIIKKQKQDILRSIRSSSCDMWHIYHFFYRSRMGDNSIYKSIFITDDDILSDFIKALNLIGIHEAAVKGQLAFESIVRDLVSSQDDLDKITDWYLKSSRTHESLSILSLRRAVDAMSEQISDLYDLKGLPWQTHKIKTND